MSIGGIQCGPICAEQCANYRGSDKCTPGVQHPCDHPRCLCQPGHAFIDKGKCVPVDSDECGGLAV